MEENLNEDARTDAEQEGYEDGMKDEKEDEEDDEIDLEDMTEDELKDLIEDVIEDMVRAGELEAGEKFEDEDEEEDIDIDIDTEEEINERKKEGYDDREDESVSARMGKEADKKQSFKARRDDSYGKFGKRDAEAKGMASGPGKNKINKEGMDEAMDEAMDADAIDGVDVSKLSTLDQYAYSSLKKPEITPFEVADQADIHNKIDELMNRQKVLIEKMNEHKPVLESITSLGKSLGMIK
jgi:hypothetical protein